MLHPEASLVPGLSPEAKTVHENVIKGKVSNRFYVQAAGSGRLL
jgi:hypothetical protein